MSTGTLLYFLGLYAVVIVVFYLGDSKSTALQPGACPVYFRVLAIAIAVFVASWLYCGWPYITGA